MDIAAGSKGIAPPGGILVSSDVVNRTGRLFQYGPAQQEIVKETTNPIETYELLRELSEGEQDEMDRESVFFVGGKRTCASFWPDGGPRPEIGGG